jgi:hypothetical protein
MEVVFSKVAGNFPNLSGKLSGKLSGVGGVSWVIVLILRGLTFLRTCQGSYFPELVREVVFREVLRVFITLIFKGLTFLRTCQGSSILQSGAYIETRLSVGIVGREVHSGSNRTNSTPPPNPNSSGDGGRVVVCSTASLRFKGNPSGWRSGCRV